MLKYAARMAPAAWRPLIQFVARAVLIIRYFLSQYLNNKEEVLASQWLSYFLGVRVGLRTGLPLG